MGVRVALIETVTFLELQGGGESGEADVWGKAE